MVIILSKISDVHSQAVKRELNIMGHECIIIDTEEFPSQITLEIRYTSDSSSLYYRDVERELVVDLNEITGIWRRRIYGHIVSDELMGVYKEISLRDTRDVLAGFFYVAAEQCKVINNPIYETAALNKIYQLSIAEKCGFLIPNSVITNNPTSVEEFYTSLNLEKKKMVYKGLNSPQRSHD